MYKAIVNLKNIIVTILELNVQILNVPVSQNRNIHFKQMERLHTKKIN
jgi:hypothetical protein